MPELPDLQVFRKNLEKKFAGKKLTKVEVLNERKVNVPESTLKSKLEGKRLETIYRDGKELFFSFEGDQTLSVHLMLKGEFRLYNESNDFKYKIIEFMFKDKTGLALTDFRKRAMVRLNPLLPEVPDALSKEFTQKYFIDGLKKYKLRKIKELITDQKFVRGIGNAYSDEILWTAGIHPLSKAGKIPDEKIKKLYKSIGKILKDAEKKIIKTDPDRVGGEVREFLEIHNSRKKKSPTGAAIKKLPLGGRSTYYTDEQVLYE